MTPEELEHIAQTEQEAQAKFTQTVNVCVAAGCLSCQSQSVKDALDKEVARRGWGDHCKAKGVGCMGLCSEGPLVSTSQTPSSNSTLYKRVAPEDSASLLDALDGTPVSRLLCPTDVPFFQRQKKIVFGELWGDRSGAH
jgi:bidirectional [NiFe] hydrogenase diaphorase subunit